jgi:hypothetical protein
VLKSWVILVILILVPPSFGGLLTLSEFFSVCLLGSFPPDLYTVVIMASRPVSPLEPSELKTPVAGSIAGTESSEAPETELRCERFWEIRQRQMLKFEIDKPSNNAM